MNVFHGLQDSKAEKPELKNKPIQEEPIDYYYEALYALTGLGDLLSFVPGAGGVYSYSSDMVKGKQVSMGLLLFALVVDGIPGGSGAKGAAKGGSKFLLWGKNSTGHLIKHRDALGLGNISTQQAQKMLPQLRGAANQLLKNANPALTRVGQWHSHQNAIMYISNGKMLVTEANGTFITVVNKTSNQWYNAAKTLK